MAYDFMDLVGGELVANLFEKLMNRRYSMNVTLDELSLKTKLPITHLIALEEGDLSKFSHDIAMVKFYLLSYCNALDIDFNEIESELDEIVSGYSHTMMLKKRQERENNYQSVMKRVSRHQQKINYRPREIKLTNTNRSKIILLISIVCFLLVILILLFKFVLPIWGKESLLSFDDKIEKYVLSVDNDNVSNGNAVSPIVSEDSDLALKAYDVIENNLNNYSLVFNKVRMVNFKFVAENSLKLGISDGDNVELLPFQNLSKGDDVSLSVNIDKNDRVLVINVIGSNNYKLFVNDELVDINTLKLSSEKNFIIFNFRLEGRDEYRE